MGSLQAAEFARFTSEGQIDIDMALHWHLTSNHYPPVPTTMIEPCKEAIELANLGHYDSEVELPAPILYQGKNVAPVHVVIDAHHLESFLNLDEAEEDDDFYDVEEDDEEVAAYYDAERREFYGDDEN